MTALLQTGDLRLDRRWFLLFLGLLSLLLPSCRRQWWAVNPPHRP